MQLMDSFLNFFIGPALASDASATVPANSGSSYSLIVMTVVFVLFMYFIMWRPQSRRAKEHRNLLSSLAKGDEVVTIGGILGRVSKLSDQYLVIALTDQVEITVQKSSIANVLPKGTLKSIT